MDWSALLDRPFQQRAIVRGLPGLGVVIGTQTSTGFVARRTSELITAGTDDLVLTILQTGRFMQRQLGRETELAPGEAILGSGSDVGEVMLQPNSSFVALSLPRHAMIPVLAYIQDRVGASLPASSEPLRLLTSYVSNVLCGAAPVTSPILQQRVVSHVYDLVALALSRSPGINSLHGGTAAARLNAIKSDILAHLGDGSLSESMIASRHGITARYIRLLFQVEETTFSDFVRNARLVRAHRILTDPCLSERTITSIAYEVGFCDLSHFNRLFRKTYGARPSEIRPCKGARVLCSTRPGEER
ncbi:putative Transcriptional activator rhrA [Bradyrhizobium sp. STM 3843]|nr:putative Transcriptional activator rhrA [Bradyrhizobium sp. STM 3843]